MVRVDQQWAEGRHADGGQGIPVTVGFRDERGEVTERRFGGRGRPSSFRTGDPMHGYEAGHDLGTAGLDA